MREIGSRDFEEIINADSLVVIDFYADWCAPCRFLSPVLEKLEKEFSGEVHFYKLNVDRYPELANVFGITSIPAVLMFKKGKLVNGFIGAMPESMVREEIKKALSMNP